MNKTTKAGCQRSATTRNNTRGFTSKVLVALFSLSFFIFVSAQAQSTVGNIARPACNLSGSLEVDLTDVNRGSTTAPVIVIAEVGKTDASTQLTYSFENNASGATIQSYGPRSYDARSKKTVQRLFINPGTEGTGFNLKLTATNANGVECSCSKSVSVIR